MGVSVYMQKMPTETKHFNKNQKVWVQKAAGDLRAKVTGRFRGSGKYISSWIDIAKNALKEIEVDRGFVQRHRLQEIK